MITYKVMTQSSLPLAEIPLTSDLRVTLYNIGFICLLTRMIFTFTDSQRKALRGFDIDHSYHAKLVDGVKSYVSRNAMFLNLTIPPLRYILSYA